jgi:hypothetical protein
MESIAADIRRGIPWVLLPVGAAMAVRLALEPAYASGAFLALAGLVAAFGFAHTWLARSPSAWRIRVALLVNFLAINVGYMGIGLAMKAHAGWRADDLVYAIDRTLFGGDPQRFLAAISTPWLSTAVMLGYLTFFGFLLFLFLSEAFRLSRATGRVQLGLMRLYGLGFSGYILLPAAGPALHHPALLPPIRHSAFTAALQPWVLGNCSGVDVCPSIHAAVCAFTLVWTWRRRHRLFWWLLPSGAALLLGTVYLQYHYFLDLPFGLLLGAGAARSISHDDDIPPPVHGSAGAAG